jgi:hypothetical protein
MPVRESVGGASIPVENPAFVLVDVDGVPASISGGGGGSGLSQAQTRDAVRDGVNLSTADAIPVTFNIVGGATGLQGVWNVSANTVRRIGTTATITVGAATGNATSIALASGGAGGGASGGIAVYYDVVNGSFNLEGAWDVANSQVYPKGSGAAIAVGTAAGNARNLSFAENTEFVDYTVNTAHNSLAVNDQVRKKVTPLGTTWAKLDGTALPGATPVLANLTPINPVVTSSGGSSAIAVNYDVVGGGTGLQGIWDISANKIKALGSATELTIGTATGNATNLLLSSGSAAVIQSDTYRAIQANATAGIVNERQYLRRQILSASGTVLNTAWIDLELGTLLTQTQVAAINIVADLDPGSAVSTVTGTRLRSQDWIVVANGGDTASGLARYAIAREFVTEDASGTVTAPFWTNSADTVITAPARSNLVRVEQGYPEPISVKYALNNAPTVFLNGYAVRLPNNVIELYSNFNLSTLVPQGAGATEAIASSISPSERRIEENTAPARTPTIFWHTFLATRTEQVFNLVNARNWAIANNGGVPIQYAYTANATTQTPFYMGIPPNVQVFPVSGQNYTGPLAISVDLLPNTATLVNGTSVLGSDQITFAVALPADTVVPRQMITGPGIPANTFIKNWDPSRTIVSLCDASGAPVNAIAGAGNGSFITSGAPVLVEVWT